MKKHLILMIYVCFLMLSCRNNTPTATTQKPNPEGSDTTTVTILNEKVHVVINSPTDIWQTDYLTFQVTHSQHYEGRSLFTSGESDYKKVESVGAKCWNLLFYNTKTQEYDLLEPDKKMLIYHYELNDTANGKVMRNWSRYDIQFDDNKDGKFTNSDAKRIFISNRFGKGFRQISPDNVNIQHYTFSTKENFMLMYGTKDTNQDGLFDDKDGVFVYRLNLNQEIDKILPAQLLVPKAFYDKLQRKVEKEWILPEK